MKQRKYKHIILLFCILLLPFFSLLNNVAVQLVSQTRAYRLIEQTVIPAETETTLFVLQILHIKAFGSSSIISAAHDGKWQNFIITWNCTGWQSLVMLLISYITLTQYKGIVYKKAFIILAGIIWIFITNIIRITLEISIFHHAGLQPASIFHDWFAKAYIILMFSLFWIISYALVLKSEIEKSSLRIISQKK